METTTPWGTADHSKKYAYGVIFYVTPSHGGFHVSPSVLKTWPAELQQFQSYADSGWFEEDCDWAIVALAMPELFSDKEKHSALQTVQQWHTDEACIVAYLASERGRAFVESVTAWGKEQSQVGNYQPCGGCSDGPTWNQRWMPYNDDLPQLVTVHKDYPMDLPSLATKEMLEMKYGKVLQGK